MRLNGMSGNGIGKLCSAFLGIFNLQSSLVSHHRHTNSLTNTIQSILQFQIILFYFYFLFIFHISSEILMESQNLEINKNVARNPQPTSQKDATKKQVRSVYTVSTTTQSKKVTISKPPTDNKQPYRPAEGNVRI